MKCVYIFWHKRVHITEEGQVSVNDEILESTLYNDITNSERNNRKSSIERLRRQISIQFKKLRSVQHDELSNADELHKNYYISLRKMSRSISQTFQRITPFLISNADFSKT